MNNSAVSIDIIVPTYNRPVDIARFVSEIRLQQYPAFHVWIIDDCGEILLNGYVPENDDRFTLIRLPENKGQAYARNVALESGSADIIVSLDDDAWFDNDVNALGKVVAYFDQYADAGCLAFNTKTPVTSYDNNTVPGSKVPFHITCGSAYRRKVLEDVDGFSGFLHSGAEETDLSLKITERGYAIRFAAGIKVFHNFQPGERSKKWYVTTRYNTTRNDLLIVVMRYPAKYVVLFVISKFASHLRFAVSHRQYVPTTIWYTIKAFFGFLQKLPTALKLRKPLTKAQFKNWREMIKA